MSDYTPSTDEIRQATIPGSRESWGEGYFERWLAEHDRAVKAEAWDEGALATQRLMLHPDDNGTPTNPHREGA